MAAKKRNNSVVGTSHIRSVCSPTTPIVGLTNVHSVLYDIPEHCDPQLHLVLIKPSDYILKHGAPCMEAHFVCPSEICLHQKTKMS